MPEDYCLPNLLILGQQKAGTTWLFHQLAGHSMIQGSEPKELFFFSRSPKWIDKNLDTYRRHFPRSPGIRYYVEASANYFWVRRTPDEFDDPFSLPKMGGETHRTVLRILGPDVPLIVLFRHPLARAVSAYFHNFRRGRINEREPFLDAGKRFGIFSMSRIAYQTRQWLGLFRRENFFFGFFDDVKREPLRLVADVCQFLNLPFEYQEALEPGRRNPGFDLIAKDGAIEIDGESRSRINLKFLRQNLPTLPRILAGEIEILAREFAEDITFVQDLTGRNLEHWRTTDLCKLLTM